MAKNLDFRRPHTARAGILKLYYTAMPEGLALETFPSDMAAEFFEEAACGRSASHDLPPGRHLELRKSVKKQFTRLLTRREESRPDGVRFEFVIHSLVDAATWLRIRQHSCHYSVIRFYKL